MTTLQDWTDAFDAAIVANSVTLDEGAGTRMSYIMYTDPIYGTDTLWTMVGLVKAAEDWGDSDWQATVTLADQAEGSDKTSSWTCRLTATGFDAATGTWGSLDTKFIDGAATTVKNKSDGLLTQTGTWTETTTWLTSQWKEELEAYWEDYYSDETVLEDEDGEGEEEVGEGDAITDDWSAEGEGGDEGEGNATTDGETDDNDPGVEDADCGDEDGCRRLL